MKKLLYILIVSLFVAGLAGCSTEKSESVASSEEVQKETEAEKPDSDTKENTGSTEIVSKVNDKTLADIKVDGKLILTTLEDIKRNYNICATTSNVGKIDTFVEDKYEKISIYESNIGSSDFLVSVVKLKGSEGFNAIFLKGIVDTPEQIEEFATITYTMAVACDFDITKNGDIGKQMVLGMAEAMENIGEASFIVGKKFFFAYEAGEDKEMIFTVMAPTDLDSIEKSETPETSESLENSEGKEYEFTAGNYIVGENIPAGKYDVEWVSGSGNCFTGTMIEVFGERDGDIKSFKNLELTEGETIEVKSTLRIKFIAK